MNGRLLIGLFAALGLCSCATQIPFGGDAMPPTQVAMFLKVLTPASEYDQPPKFLHGSAPFSPVQLARKGYWGYTEIEFTVQTDGSTGQFRFMNTTALPFAREAALALQKWKFAPALKNGRPVPVRVRLPFTFRS